MNSLFLNNSFISRFLDSSKSSNVCHKEISNAPIFVLLSFVTYQPVHNISHKSAAIDLIYVHAVTSAFKERDGYLKSCIPIFKIVISLVFISTTFHSLTKSHAFLPPIFNAEYFGGTCVIVQVKCCFKIYSSFSIVNSFLNFFCRDISKKLISSAKSNDSVVQSRFIVNSYSLVSFSK